MKIGRHPCAGMRVAKLEMKLVLALIFAGYEFSIVDAKGNLPTELPRPDKNDIQQVSLRTTLTMVVLTCTRRGPSANLVSYGSSELWSSLLGRRKRCTEHCMGNSMFYVTFQPTTGIERKM